MPADKPILAFLTNEGDEEEGLGHAGIETYRDAPVASIGRECGQNSADARVTAPVVMEFDVFDIPADDYPCRVDQLAAIDACLDRARRISDRKAVDFFARARSMLSAPTIRVLRISDSNTKGLVGPAEGGTPFNSLLKGAGVSSKERDTSGGSFGIGKNAAFAASDLQTVFYSTIYFDVKTGTPQFLAQGKTILVSHTDHAGTKRRRVWRGR